MSLGFQLFLFTPLWAIPSPDLVVNFVASAAQVLGLLTVVAGSFAFSKGRRGGATRPSAGWKWAFRATFVLLLVSFAVNVFQYSGAADDRNRRLQTNLWRSTTEEGRKVGDINLKTLAFGDQQKDPKACTTDDLNRWLAEGRELNLIDVRETEETEMGMLPGAWHRRYPDIQKDRTGLIQEGKETVLLCESGNRSGELCDYFLKDDVRTRFMMGGYEKWVAEGRELANARERGSGQIRDIPGYPTKMVLLDTPEVMALLEQAKTEGDKPLFVDVRYPGDFEVHHLPGAVNLPMRKLTSEELWPALKGLPKRPIIAPCYDKRSSFFGMLLGLRLHRLGYQFLGRYSVPYEFAVAAEDKAWVAQWKEAQAGKTPLGMISAPLHGALGWLKERTGRMAAAIAILVIILRLLVLPLTVKSERDQIVQKQLAARVRKLKADLAEDPPRFGRAVRALYRKEGLTPGRNLLGTMAQLILFLVFFSVVNDASAATTEGFLWLGSLAIPDPTYALPIAVAGLMFAYLAFGAARRTLAKLAIHAAVAVLLFLLVAQLRAGVNLYLVLNLAILLIQSVMVHRWLAARQATTPSPAEAPLAAPAIVALRHAHRAEGTGNKALRLARMLEAGLPVPDGFVVTDRILSRQKDRLELTKSERRQVSKAWKRLQARNVAVRSSGLNEDGANKSYAGVFESLLNVPFSRLVNALEEVRASLRSTRAEAYSGNGTERGGILVQKMIPAEYAGVLFTEHPVSAGSILVEMVPGLGDALVSGCATPRAYRFGRVTGRLIEGEHPPMDLSPLLALGRKVEKTFGKPQDIEWAYSKGAFFILQSRDITVTARARPERQGILEAERHRLIEAARLTLETAEKASRRGRPPAAGDRDEVIFAQNELTELLPRPTPLSLSFMESLWSSGGTTDLACRLLGIPYRVDEDSPPFVATAFGALYINRKEEKRRLAGGCGAMAAFRLGRASRALEDDLRASLPEFLREMRLRETMDFTLLPAAELLHLLRSWKAEFVTRTYVNAEKINLAADFYLKIARLEIEKRGLDSLSHLGRGPETIIHQAMSLLPGIASGERGVEEFLDLFGHRSPLDYELAQPRYRKDVERVLELAARSGGAPVPHEPLREPEGSLDSVFLFTVERARRFQSLKEEAKHHALRELALIRAVILALADRLSLGGDIFYLTIEEVARLDGKDLLERAPALIAERKAAAEAFEGIVLPTELTLAQLEALSTDDNESGAGNTDASALKGTRVSGQSEVMGRVRVVVGEADIRAFQRGEILVARCTDPTWTPLFPLARGLITEVGGWLSHAAIVAREYGLPAIVGARGAMHGLKTGQLVCLRADGRIESVADDRRIHPRVAAAAKVALLRQGEIISAMLRNLSTTGAFIETSEELVAGQDLKIRISAGSEEVHAEVVRRDGTGGYALHFAVPLKAPLPIEGGPEKN